MTSRYEWLCKHNRLRPEPIKFVTLDSEHAQSDEVRESRTSGVGPGQVAILGADQKERGLSGRECLSHMTQMVRHACVVTS